LATEPYNETPLVREFRILGNVKVLVFTDWIIYYVLQSSWEDRDTGKVYSCVDLYFVTQVSCYNYGHYSLLCQLRIS